MELTRIISAQMLKSPLELAAQEVMQALGDAEQRFEQQPSAQNGFTVAHLKGKLELALQAARSAPGDQLAEMPNFHELTRHHIGFASGENPLVTRQPERKEQRKVPRKVRPVTPEPDPEESEEELPDVSDAIAAFQAQKKLVDLADLKNSEVSTWRLKLQNSRINDAANEKMALSIVQLQVDFAKKQIGDAKIRKQQAADARVAEKQRIKEAADHQLVEVQRRIDKIELERRRRIRAGCALPTDAEPFDVVAHIPELLAREAEEEKEAERKAEENLAQTKADKLVEREVQRLIAMRKRAKTADKVFEQAVAEHERLSNEAEIDSKRLKGIIKVKDKQRFAMPDQIEADNKEHTERVIESTRLVDAKAAEVEVLEAELARRSDNVSQLRRGHSNGKDKFAEMNDAFLKWQPKAKKRIQQLTLASGKIDRNLRTQRAEMGRKKKSKGGGGVPLVIAMLQAEIEKDQNESEALLNQRVALEAELELREETNKNRFTDALANAQTKEKNTNMQLSDRTSELQKLQATLDVDKATAAAARKGADTEFQKVLDDRTTAMEQMVLVKSKMAQSKKYKKTSYEANHETRRLWGEVRQAEKLLSPEARILLEEYDKQQAPEQEVVVERPETPKVRIRISLADYAEQCVGEAYADGTKGGMDTAGSVEVPVLRRADSDFGVRVSDAKSLALSDHDFEQTRPSTRQRNWRIEFKIKYEQEANEKLRQENVKLRVLAQHRVVEESAAAVLHHQSLIQNKCIKERQFDELCEAKRIMQQEQARIDAIPHAARGTWKKSRAELLHDQKLEIRRRREAQEATGPGYGKVTKVWSGYKGQGSLAATVPLPKRPGSRALSRQRSRQVSRGGQRRLQVASGPKLAPLDETTAVEPPKSPDHGASSKPSAVPKGGAKKNLWDLDRARTPLDIFNNNQFNRLLMHRTLRKGPSVHWALRSICTPGGSAVALGHNTDSNIANDKPHEACYTVWKPSKSCGAGPTGLTSGSILRSFR